MSRTISALALLVGVCIVAIATIPLAAATNTLIMSGLNSPRGLALGPDGGIYVAEGGTGGAGPCVISGANENRCFGKTGAVSRFLNGVQQRMLSGLPSHALPNGDQGGGPNDISFQGATMFVLMGLGFDPSVRPSFGPDGNLFGKLLRATPGGQLVEAGDVSAYESQTNPAGGPVDSNPYGLLSAPGVTLVADAGANAILSVIGSGLVNTVAVLPSRPARSTDSVPTSVAIGPDGAYYVSELSGVPFARGAASVYRVVPRQQPRVFQGGFTTITDIAFGPDGSLYVVEHSGGPVFFATPGDIVKVAPDGTRTVLVSNLNRPTSVLVASDGSVYYTNKGITAGQGEVWKYTP